MAYIVGYFLAVNSDIMVRENGEEELAVTGICCDDRLAIMLDLNWLEVGGS